jgi:hypothetical protein
VLALVVAAAALIVVLAGGDADDSSDRRAATCRKLGGDLRVRADGGAACDVQRTAFAVDVVVLRPDGSLDPADARRRRAACEAVARTARDRARSAARTRTVRSYASSRWAAPGVCRSTRVALGAAEGRALRAERLVDEALAGLDADPEAALRLAERADAVRSTAASRAAIGRARDAIRRTTAPGSGASPQLVSPNEYLGLGCDQIGHEFRVAPGSDPAHDPDGDGRACEGG